MLILINSSFKLWKSVLALYFSFLCPLFIVCVYIRFISMAMDILPQTSNIKAITICFIAIIAIIENSEAVKETSMLSTDALLSLRLDLCSQRGVIHSLKPLFIPPHALQFHRSPSLLNPTAPPYITLSTTNTSFLVFSLSLSFCGLPHVFPILAVMHSSPQSDLISPVMCVRPQQHPPWQTG